METFLFITAEKSDIIPAVLKTSADTLQELLKEHTSILRFDTHYQRDEPFGFLTVINKKIGSRSLIDSYFDQNKIVVSFGDISGQNQGTARIIHESWIRGGGDEVKTLNGCFSSIIFNKADNKLDVMGDFIGQRTLRYAEMEKSLILSPHDITLISTGMHHFNVDHTSVASIAAFGWSLDEVSLLKDIKVCRPYEILTFHKGSKTLKPYSFFKGLQIIDPLDTTSIRLQKEQILEEMGAYTSHMLSNNEKPVIELSAGLDTRAVLSILLGCTEAANITAFSDGSPDSTDVKVAKTIASRLGISFKNNKLPKPNPNEIRTDMDHTILATNGNINTLVTMTNQTIDLSCLPVLSFCGDGGEIFRAYYYPVTLFGIKRSLDRQRVLDKLAGKSCIHSLFGINSTLGKAILDRLSKIVDGYLLQTQNCYDVLDFFYMWERYGVWNMKLRRSFSSMNRTGPFFCRNAIRYLYTLPRPIGLSNTIHADAIKKYAPSCYTIPINGEICLPLRYGHPILSGIADVIEGSFKVKRKFRNLYHQKFKPAVKKESGDLESQRIKYFNQMLKDEFNHMLTDEKSASSFIFGNERIKTIISSQISGNPEHAELLGSLISIERYLILCDEVTRHAFSFKSQSSLKHK